MRLPCTLLLAFLVTPVFAGRYNRVHDIGDEAPDWSGLVGTDDEKYAAADFADKKALVILFTSNGCPYAQDVQSKVIELYKNYADEGVGVIAVNANKDRGDGLEAMKEVAEQNEYPFPYLFDESQQMARDFGARYTPEFYVLDQDGRIVYMGAYDDSFSTEPQDQHFVKDAVDAVLSGTEPEVAETAPVGCSIRFDRRRRRAVGK